MKFLLADFDGVLGLRGEIVFPFDRPLIIYGSNAAGKSSIINALRYCLNPPLGRRPSDYAEGKLPSKDEMLVAPLDEGAVTLYFVAGGDLYKLLYEFRRTTTDIYRDEALYVTPGTPPTDNVASTLTAIDWGAPEATGVTAIKERLQADRISPELLDVLIAPSNVANFADAIGGELISVPELIQKQIEQRRQRAQFYRENFRHSRMSVRPSVSRPKQR